MNKIKLLIVDDSALIRKLLTEIFQTSDEIEVFGVAADPFIARDKIKKLNPDVLTLDVEMPRMDGLTFLRNLMRLRPMPVVMISTLTEKGAEITLEALAIGAVDFVSKPKLDVSNALQDYTEEIISKVKSAAKSNFSKINQEEVIEKKQSHADQKPNIEIKKKIQSFNTTEKIIAVGSSTGGTEAIKALVKSLPSSFPAIVISQHLPLAFSQSFAAHVNDATDMTACIAKQGQHIIPGTIYIAPGGKHLRIVRDGARYVCLLNDDLPVNRHKPSVDVMFQSVAEHVGKNAIGVMLTGMGMDGAAGMLQMKQAGAVNIVQDEETSVVWGMPGEAYKVGAADYVEPLDAVADRILAVLTSSIEVR